MQASNRAIQNVEWYRAQVRLHPNNPGFHVHLGEAYLAAGKPQLAVYALLRANRLAHGNALTLTALGEARCALRQYRSAVSALSAALRFGSTSARTWAALGWAYSGRGDFKRAAAAYAAATDIDPDQARLRPWLEKAIAPFAGNA